MSPRITDQHGARWPVTGQRCPVCGMPASGALGDRAHPSHDLTVRRSRRDGVDDLREVRAPALDDDQLADALGLVLTEVGTACRDCGIDHYNPGPHFELDRLRAQRKETP